MDLYVYSDESGVFDKSHNDIFVFGGVIFLSKQAKDNEERKYRRAERIIRERTNTPDNIEIKASTISNSDKSHLFRSINNVEKFGIIINQNLIRDEIFTNKKTKQRYLDWAFKYSLKNKLKELIKEQKIIKEEVRNVHIFVDTHSTATDGMYELNQSIEQEFKIGIVNYEYMSIFPPLFTNAKEVSVKFCDSSKHTLVREADIVANRLYYCAINNKLEELKNKNIYISYHPYQQK